MTLVRFISKLDSIRKERLKACFIHEHRSKILNKVLANQIYWDVKRKSHYGQFIPLISSVFNIRKYVIYPSGLKEKNYIINSMDEENHLIQTQYSIIIKILSKVGIQKNIFNLINDIYPKIRESIIFKRETLEIFCGRCDYCSQFFTPSSAMLYCSQYSRWHLHPHSIYFRFGHMALFCQWM